MAIVASSHNEDVTIRLRVHAVAEPGPPRLLRVELAAFRGTKRVIHDTPALSDGDVAGLVSDLQSIVDGSANGARRSTIDGDVSFEAYRIGPDEVFFGFWAGQPFELIRGFGLLSSDEALTALADTLRTELSALQRR